MDWDLILAIVVAILSGVCLFALGAAAGILVSISESVQARINRGSKSE